MDALAALTAPTITEIDPLSLGGFLRGNQLRLVQLHREAGFGVLLKGLLHAGLGTHLRCGRIALDRLDPGCGATTTLLRPWVDLAGARFPPPAGYYLLKGKKLLGYHPELDVDGSPNLAVVGLRGARLWLRQRDPRAAGRAALSQRPELDVLRFFEGAATSAVPLRASVAPDRRSQADRRGGSRATRSRRAQERLQAELRGALRLFGLSADAPISRVKQVRNRLMRTHHPDHPDPPGGRAAATAFTVRVNEAYRVIRHARQSSAA